MSDYIGIDYSMGQSNFDPENGIHFGVISMNSLCEFAWEDFEADYGPATCGHCGNEAVDFDREKHGDWQNKRGCADYACEHYERVFDSQDAFGDDPCGHTLDDGEYQAFIDEYNDVMIIKSPYYTHAQFCSPCAPGAGHLAHPVEGGPKTYCFGHDWFDAKQAPYPVYNVSDGTLVKPD